MPLARQSVSLRPGQSGGGRMPGTTKIRGFGRRCAGVLDSLPGATHLRLQIKAASSYSLHLVCSTVSGLPRVAHLPARPSLILRIMRGHINDINKRRVQTLNRSPRCRIFRVASDCHRLRHGPNKWSECPASLQCVTTPPVCPSNLKSNMPNTPSHVLRIPDSKIDVSNIRSVHHDPKVIVRH